MDNAMTWILWLFLSFVTPAQAQCSGVFSPGTVCGVGGSIAAPPGQTKLSSGFTTPLVTPTTDGQNVLFQNGTKSAFAVYGPAAPPGVFDYDNIRSVIDVEPGTAVQNYNAYGAWIWNNAAASLSCSGLACPAAVGMEAYCVNVVANAQCFGFNPAVTDSFDGSALHSVASTVIGMEVDVMTANAGTTATGISIGIQGPTQAAGANAIQTFVTSGTTARFSNGFAVGDGNVATGGSGLVLGAIQVASGTSIFSSPITFNIFDSSGAEHHIVMQGAPIGTASEVVLSDALAVSGLTFIMAASGTPAQIAASGTPAQVSLKLSGKGSTSGVILNANASNMFDCNVTFAGYCTVTSANGLAMNTLNIIQVGNLLSNTTSSYELLAQSATSSLPTLVPNQGDLKAGIGADVGGDVSIIADNAGTAVEQIRATGIGSQLRGGGAAMFDCNITATGYCTVLATNGLNANGLNIININSAFSNTNGSYELIGQGASATLPTFAPNRNDVNAGIGADQAGDLSLIVDKSATGYEAIRITSQAITLNTSLQYQSSTTGAGTQTFTNSPCSGLTTERWIPVKITGQVSTFFIPACS